MRCVDLLHVGAVLSPSFVFLIMIDFQPLPAVGDVDVGVMGVQRREDHSSGC